jgi:Uma2 family endonuclease
MSTSLFTATAPPALGPYRLRDYDQLPEEPRYELVFGRLCVTPSALPSHATVSQVLTLLLARIAHATGGIVYQEQDVVLADHSVVRPDIVYLSPSRLQIVRKRVEGAPDLVIEILSSSTSRFDRGRKRDLYALSGVKEYWLVDRERRQIEFLINEAGQFVASTPVTAEYRSPTNPEIHLDVSELWQLVDEWLVRVPRGW